jgi:hypothetical protein
MAAILVLDQQGLGLSRSSFLGVALGYFSSSVKTMAVQIPKLINGLSISLDHHGLFKRFLSAESLTPSRFGATKFGLV